MKPKLNAVIIGAGGVTSYMLPALKNTFDLTATYSAFSVSSRQ